MKLYRALVRSKLDYGSIVYGSAKKHILKLLDPIHHQGLRIALGAFRTSPVKSLYVEAGEPSLEDRRLKLSMNYFLKLKSLPENPCFDSVSNCSSLDFFERAKTEPCFSARTLTHILKAEIDPQCVDNQQIKAPPPWENTNIKLDLSLTSFTKNETNELTFRNEFKRVEEKYSGNNFCPFYTDGSKRDEKVAAASFCPKHPNRSQSIRLRDNSSVFNAELQGILLAVKGFKPLTYKYDNLVLYTDSLSVCRAIECKNFKNNVV